MNADVPRLPHRLCHNTTEDPTVEGADPGGGLGGPGQKKPPGLHLCCFSSLSNNHHPPPSPFGRG